MVDELRSRFVSGVMVENDIRGRIRRDRIVPPRDAVIDERDPLERVESRCPRRG